jgi:hypothetical protein
MPGKPFQSKLEPFTDFIRGYRAKRWSYTRIAEALKREHGISAAPSTIFSFVKVRAKGRRLYALPPRHGTNQKTASSELQEQASEFFAEPNAPSTPKTTHEKRPYRLNF